MTPRGARDCPVHGLVLGSALAVLACAAPIRARPEAPPVVAQADLSPLEQGIVKAVNDLRATAGADPLLVSAELSRIARAHSEDQALRGRSGHDGSGGTTPADRALRNAISYRTLAENVAMNQGYSDPVEQAVTGWMESAHHRENILNPVFEETGVGIAPGTDGKIYFTQLFLDPPAAR